MPFLGFPAAWPGTVCQRCEVPIRAALPTFFLVKISQKAANCSAAEEPLFMIDV